MSVNNIQGMRSDIAEMISKMREMSNQQQGLVQPQDKIAESSGFNAVMQEAKSAINQVSELQNVSKTVRDAYVSGSENVSLTDVVLASQKSGLAFQALVTVRNRLLEAYRQVMDMPV
jgi:flagellar hook-basal body complex protein FliE